MMNFDEIFDHRPWLRGWVEHELRQYGATPEAGLLMDGPDRRVRVLVVTDVGLLDLVHDEEGPRSIPTIYASGRLLLWSTMSDLAVTTTSDPPTPARGRDDWSSVMKLALPAAGIELDSQDRALTGFGDFARACIRAISSAGPSAR